MAPRRKTLDLGYVPRKWQARVHRERKRFSVLVCHRRAGKTIFAVFELLLAALSTPDGHFAYIAPFYAQAKNIAWSALKLNALKIPGVEIRDSELRVNLPNGAHIRLFGADNADALRGHGFNGIVLDEVADVAPEVWGEVLRPALADKQGWALFLGTPKGTNLFSELYYRARREMSEGSSEWYAALLTVNETDALPAAEVEAARREMSERQFAAEFLCAFDAGGVDVLIPGDRVYEAQRRVLTERHLSGFGIALGVDPARFGDDSSCFILRRGPLAYGLRREHGLDTMEVVDVALQIIDEHQVDALFVDENGLGAGVCDRLRQLGKAPLGVNFGTGSPNPKYANCRARLWGEMGEWLKHGAIPDESQMATDLAAVTYKFDARQRIVLESKAEMKKRGLKSPDAADALALTFYAPTPVRDDAGFDTRRRERHTHCHGAEYDPFAEENFR
jgi:hypothetical protein